MEHLVDTWGITPAEVAEDYGLPIEHVLAALQVHAGHQAEIDDEIAAETALEEAAACQGSQG